MSDALSALEQTLVDRLRPPGKERCDVVPGFIGGQRTGKAPGRGIDELDREVLSYIEGHYVEDLSETELMYGAARGLTDVLDPHSRFMDPDEYGRLKRET